MTEQIIFVLLGTGAYTFVLVVLELLVRKKGYSPENLRRVAHITSSLFAIVFSLLLIPQLFVAVFIFLVVFMTISQKIKLLGHIHKVSRKTFGEELLPLGFLISYILTSGQPPLYIPAFLMVGFADPATGVVMARYRNHPLGILMFFIVSLVILMIFTKIALPYVLVIALTTAIVERISPYGSDNFTIPVFAALLLRMFT